MNVQEQFHSDKHLISRNKNGNIDTVLVGEKVVLETSVGNLIPRYTLDDSGRKKEAPIKFFKTGELKSLPLEEATEIKTPVGNIKSELLIFYKSGALWRTFPLNGQVSGFWTEENEFELAKTLEIPSSVGTIKVKPIYLQFYKTGELESILFWPGEQIKINTTLGEIIIHKGICFHRNGNIKGFEPLEEITVETPIGKIKAFDRDPNGIHAESHAINLYEDGSVESITTSSNEITVMENGAEVQKFGPQLKSSYCKEDAFFISPLKVIFEKDTITFAHDMEPEQKMSGNLEFQINEFITTKPTCGFSCS